MATTAQYTYEYSAPKTHPWAHFLKETGFRGDLNSGFVLNKVSFLLFELSARRWQQRLVYSIAALVSEVGGGGDRGFASCLDALLRLVFGDGQGRKRAEAGSARARPS